MEAGSNPSSNSNGEEPTSWEELYNINLMPSELFFKFRKEIEGFRVGVNLEVCFPFVPFEGSSVYCDFFIQFGLIKFYKNLIFMFTCY